MGYVDVTDKVYAMRVPGQNEHIISNNDGLRARAFGDHMPGVLKHIVIYDEGKYTMFQPEEYVSIRFKKEYTDKSKKIVLYTCNYGKYDTLVTPVKQSVECDYLCFTDDEIYKDAVYQTIIYSPADHPKYKDSVQDINKNMLNVMLCRSDLTVMEPLKKYDICIYIDGNAIIKDPYMLSDILLNIPNDTLMVLTKHPHTNSIYHEINIAKQQKK